MEPLVGVDPAHLHEHQVRRYIGFDRERRAAAWTVSARNRPAAGTNVGKDGGLALDLARRPLDDDDSRESTAGFRPAAIPMAQASPDRRRRGPGADLANQASPGRRPRQAKAAVG